MSLPPPDWSVYVDNMAALHGFTLDASRNAGVVVQIQRIEIMARDVMEFPLDAEMEPAPVFRP